MRTRLGFALAALLLGIALVVATEMLLKLLDVGAGAQQRDPFAGFSSTVPAFEPAQREDGTRILRLSTARVNPRSLHGQAEPQREFLAEKPDDAFRVFVLGGSSAAGVPYSTRYAFPAWLERRLKAAFPERRFEVVNAALSGYATRRLLAVAREISAYAPDLLIVYAGHNELAEHRYYAHLLEMNPRLFRIWEWAVGTRLYGVLARVLPVGPTPPEIDLAFRQEALESFKVLTDRAAGTGYATARELAYRDLLYEFNLGEIARTAEVAGSRLMLLTLSQNFADWQPGASSHRADLRPSEEAAWRDLVSEGDRLHSQQGDCVGAVAAYTRALTIDDQFAALHYRVATCQRELGQLGAARQHYGRASDLDRVPHGSPTYFNGIIRKVARSQRALLVDIEELLGRHSTDGLVGNDLFVDFVHPNLRAHQLIGQAVADAMRQAGWPAESQPREGSRYLEPEPSALYQADARLRQQELAVRMFACQLALRDACVAEQATKLLALDPDNEIARQVLVSLKQRDREGDEARHAQ